MSNQEKWQLFRELIVAKQKNEEELAIKNKRIELLLIGVAMNQLKKNATQK